MHGLYSQSNKLLKLRVSLFFFFYVWENNTGTEIDFTSHANYNSLAVVIKMQSWEESQGGIWAQWKSMMISNVCHNEGKKQKPILEKFNLQNAWGCNFGICCCHIFLIALFCFSYYFLFSSNFLRVAEHFRRILGEYMDYVFATYIK